MITTFFGTHNFGGDGVYIDHLSRALLRRGHQVDVIHDLNAYELARHGEPLRDYTPPDGLKLHPIRSWASGLSPLWTHQTGRLGFTAAAIRKILESNPFDVVHFHNISLLGGAETLSLASGPRRPVKLMTIHEFWLICPLSSLWKFNREICQKPECIRCSIRSGRPPQLWRRAGTMERALENIDVLIFPSQHAMSVHRDHEIRAPRLEHVPHFLSEDWSGWLPGEESDRLPRSGPIGRYFAAAGRMVPEKGFDRLIPLMASLPEMELRIAGAGPEESRLRRLAMGLPNVLFLGQLNPPDLAALFRDAIAVVVPSAFYETFGYVAVESLSVGTPVIVRDLGALPELIEASGAGLTYRTDEELLNAMRLLASDAGPREKLSECGRQAARQIWSEDAHLDRYFSLIAEVNAARSVPAATAS